MVQHLVSDCLHDDRMLPSSSRLVIVNGVSGPATVATPPARSQRSGAAEKREERGRNDRYMDEKGTETGSAVNDSAPSIWYLDTGDIARRNFENPRAGSPGGELYNFKRLFRCLPVIYVGRVACCCGIQKLPGRSRRAGHTLPVDSPSDNPINCSIFHVYGRRRPFRALRCVLPDRQIFIVPFNALFRCPRVNHIGID